MYRSLVHRWFQRRITRARPRLRRCASRVRHYALRYDDAARLARDLEQLFDDVRFSHVRVQLWPDRGKALLEGLGHVQASVFRDSGNVGRTGLTADPTHRYHPWHDWFMLRSALPVLCATPPIALDWLEPLPMSWVGIYLAREHRAPDRTPPPHRGIHKVGHRQIATVTTARHDGRCTVETWSTQCLDIRVNRLTVVHRGLGAPARTGGLKPSMASSLDWLTA